MSPGTNSTPPKLTVTSRSPAPVLPLFRGLVPADEASAVLANAGLGWLRLVDNGVIAAHGVLRVKGFVDLPGRDRRQVVQAVGDRIEQHFDRPWQPGENRATRLVVIGHKGLDRTAITAALSV